MNLCGRPLQEFCKRGHKLSETRRRDKAGVSFCYACKKMRYDADRKTHPDRIRAYQRKSKLKAAYGLRPEDIEGKPCAICGTLEFNARGPHVDHDHRTGKVRGILCHNCNTGLGLLGEANLKKAITYLEGKK